MDATSFAEENFVLDPPLGMTQEECHSLCALKTTMPFLSSDGEIAQLPVVVSCWKPSKDELEEIMKTGKVWLTILGETMPPVIVTGLKPSWVH